MRRRDLSLNLAVPSHHRLPKQELEQPLPTLLQALTAINAGSTPRLAEGSRRERKSKGFESPRNLLEFTFSRVRTQNLKVWLGEA